MAYQVKFMGEKGKPIVRRCELAGLTLTKGEAVEATDEQVEALRRHPQFGQFEFLIQTTAATFIPTGAYLAGGATFIPTHTTGLPFGAPYAPPMSTTGHETDNVLPTTNPLPGNGLDDVPGIGAEIIGALNARGIFTQDDLRRADDQTLLGISGIDRKRLGRIRAYLRR